MKLSIIIVAWRVKDQLRANLEALFNSQGGVDFEVMVVDNHSQDGTAEMVSRDFPQVKLIVNQANEGFAKANNQAWREARGDAVLLLNPDMRVFPDTLFNLATWLEANPQAGVAGGRLVDEAGKIVPNIRRFPRLGDQLAVVWKLPRLAPGILNKYLCRGFDYSRAASVDSLRGSFFAVRRSTWEKIGLLDERFFIWFEEVDYCQRVKAAGGEVWYTPAAACLDYVGQSFQQVAILTKQRYFRDSMIKYFQKWRPSGEARLLRLAWGLVWPVVYLCGRRIVKSKKGAI